MESGSSGSENSSATPNPSERPSGPATHAKLRTSALSVLLTAMAVMLISNVDIWRGPSNGFSLSWWMLGLLFIAAEVMIFNVEFRREVYTFTFSEIPLVLGLFLASPAQLVIGRLVGAGLLLVVKERQSLQKLLLNLSTFFAECAVMVTVYEYLGHHSPITAPSSWAQGLVSVAAADLLGFLVVAKVVRWHGADLQLRSILAIGALTAPVNTSLALVAGVLLTDRPWTTTLLGGITVFLVLTYRSYSALSQRHQSLSMLYDFTRLVSGAQRPEEILEAILVQAKDLLRAERAEIWLMDEQGGFQALVVDDNGRTTRTLPADTGELIASWLPASSTTLVITDETTDPALRATAAILGAQDCIIASVTESGRVVGLVAVVNRLGDTNGFRTQEGPMFATLAHHASVALENGRLIVRLHDQAREREYESLHDALTGLPNRVLFDRAVREQLIKLDGDSQLAVALMDLDGFKDINDTLGHQAGDRVLIEVARRLSGAVAPDVTVARLGGDEFCLLLPSPTSRGDAEDCARMVRAGIALPLFIDGVRINVGVSVGVALAPGDGVDGSILLQRADVAMYGAKSGLGDGVNFYHAESDENTKRRLTLASDLGYAVDNGELSLVYQPKIRLRDGRLTGFEALLRWRHEHLGLVMPDEFIPLAERTGSIQSLTQFVLRTALEQAARWHRDGHDWGVAINLSMRNLLDDELIDSIGELIAVSRVAPESVTLEITESNMMADAARTIAVLADLARLGVRLSIDDFGTGYSSLSYLQRLSVHEIKIDKSFVFPMATSHSANAIVRSVLDLAGHLDLSVVAEGVEDLQTWNQLSALGCPEAQGYFIAKPMPSEDVEFFALQWATGRQPQSAMTVGS